MPEINPQTRTTLRISTFQELRVYQEACALDKAIFEETQSWPREEKFSLTDQIRRSSRSVGASLAEAWAKRRYPAHFISKLTDSDGELQETAHWLERSRSYGYLKEPNFTALMTRCKVIGRQLGKMIQNPAPFC
jgi:four helix bundle protein